MNSQMKEPNQKPNQGKQKNRPPSCNATHLRALSEDIHLRWFLWESALMKAILSFKLTILKVEFGTN